MTRSLRSALSSAAAGLLALTLVPGPTSASAGPEAPAAAARPAPAHALPSELKAEVPELSAFHEVIYPLWHTAWPAKDAGMMKELLPQVKEDFKALQGAKLAGILRDRQVAWDQGLKEMGRIVARYDSAAAGQDVQPLLDAVEALHRQFEGMMWIVRPHSKELGAYHVGLYQIYHRFMPGKQLPQLRAMADTLGMRCADLAKAAPPRWFEGDVKALKAESETLCKRTAELKAAAAGTNWDLIDKAVEAVHSQYQKVEKLFE